MLQMHSRLSKFIYYHLLTLTRTPTPTLTLNLNPNLLTVVVVSCQRRGSPKINGEESKSKRSGLFCKTLGADRCVAGRFGGAFRGRLLGCLQGCVIHAEIVLGGFVTLPCSSAEPFD